MMKDFRKKTKNLIKLLVRQNELKLYTLKISLGECSEADFETICNLLLEIWRKMYVNHTSIFFSYFEIMSRQSYENKHYRPNDFMVVFFMRNTMLLKIRPCISECYHCFFGHLRRKSVTIFLRAKY